MATQPTKMWSGRFREPLDPDFEQWQRSFVFDWRLIPMEASASIAHARMIAAAGILTADEEQQMIEALGQLVRQEGLNDERTIFDAGAPWADSASQAEDVHHFVELELKRQIGDLALKLHTGRSRNEQIATDMRLYVGDSMYLIAEGMKRWALALVELAEQAGDAVMPSYTHLQRAEPVLVAHWLLAYVSMIERDLSRLADCKKRLSFCPLGSGAVAGATLPLDREIASRALWFTAPTPNSIDATSDRDFAIEFVQVLSTFALHISRFAEEITLFASSEFQFIELPEAFSTGSSAMPQKKNPDFTELLRGKCSRVTGALSTLLMLVKGLPLAYNKDLQEGQEAVFNASDTIIEITVLLHRFTSSLRFRYERMQEAASRGYLNAMAAATYLSNKGVPFRKAHEKIGNAVRFALESGRELNALSVEELKQFGDEFGPDFHDAISLRATIDCHDVIGGTAMKRVLAALGEARARLSEQSAVEMLDGTLREAEYARS
ncbi:argininosuccinate lyase [Terriglobus aquaticus]|uniref:Argininosuccinate lyase n=1 Tax=Terriglobus aquaticus TaxID=940139 RepID=A0ABW9KJM8_9BACT|nr:argininosuccinate lyase [Terriglobus aquaticus]